MKNCKLCMHWSGSECRLTSTEHRHNLEQIIDDGILYEVIRENSDEDLDELVELIYTSLRNNLTIDVIIKTEINPNEHYCRRFK